MAPTVRQHEILAAHQKFTVAMVQLRHTCTASTWQPAATLGLHREGTAGVGYSPSFQDHGNPHFIIWSSVLISLCHIVRSPVFAMPPKKKASDVPVFRPTVEQLQGSFETFIESVERKVAGPGICKIVPPKGWTPRKKGYNSKLDFDFQPIRQISTGSRGIYRMLLVQGKPQSLSRDFRPTALAKENLAPKTDSAEELERHYWRSLTLRPPQYGADVEGSLFDRNLKVRGIL